MAVVLRFSAPALLACRFAVSPLHETMSAVRLLANPRAAVLHEPWLRAVGRVVDDIDLAPLALLTPRNTYGPDFLSPPPSGPNTTFDEPISAVRTAPADLVRDQIARCLRERFGARARGAHALLGTDATATRDLCADLLAECWGRLVEPWWPRIVGLLQADIAYRSQVLADGGLAAMLTDLHRQVRWVGTDLHIAVNAEATRSVGPDGIVLMPGAFEWPGMGVAHDPPWAPTINYPARGAGGLWGAAATAGRALVALLGQRRATVLGALVEAQTTSGLAVRCQLPTSSVSEHLAVLRAAGLTTATRTGRYVMHARTPLGAALAGDAAAETADEPEA
jgi:DNA-binding transcriptional ArsR family regulator